MSLRSIVQTLGGELYDGGRRANIPAPGHSTEDRSVSLLLQRFWNHEFYDVGSWYVVAECWDVLAVLEELDQQEERSCVPFQLEAGPISHFARIIAIDTTLRFGHERARN